MSVPRQETESTSHDGPTSFSSIPIMGYTEESILEYMNACSQALMDGLIDEKRNDSLQGNARVALRAVASRDSKSKITQLEKMLHAAQSVANAGLRREAEDRHHVTAGGGEASDEANDEPE